MQFLKAIKKAFIVDDVTDDPDRDAYERENIFLYALHPAQLSDVPGTCTFLTRMGRCTIKQKPKSQ
jgi:hypothetical protein